MAFTSDEYQQILKNSSNVAAIERRFARKFESIKLGSAAGFGSARWAEAWLGWRQQALRDMHADLFEQYRQDLGSAVGAEIYKAGSRLPSHQQMARVRAARQRLHASQTADPLSTREPGWVLAEQTRRRAARVAAKLEKERARLEAAFMPAYEAAGFRQAVTSAWVDDAGHSTSVYVAEHLGVVPTARSEATTVWAQGKCRSGTYSTHQFWLPRAWARRVQAKGLALIDGLLTLDAKRVASKSNHALVEAYEATWCRQSVGTSLVTERGVIARLSPDHPWVHGRTLEVAVRVARRRADATRADERRATRQAMRDQAIADGDWSAVWPDQDLEHVVVCLVDSEKVGNCDPGTQSWIARYLPEYIGEDCAPAAVVLAAAAQDTTSTRRRAVAAVHRAILRSRKAA